MLILFLAALPAPITRVVVFADRAEVTRKAEIACNDGTAEVSLPPIPIETDERLMRLELGGGARVTTLETKVVMVAAAVDPRKAAIEKEREALRRRLEEHSDALRILDEREQSVEKLSRYFAAVTGEEMRNAKPPVDQWKRAFDTLRSERAAMSQKRATIASDQRVDSRKLQRLEKKLALLGGDGQRQARAVAASIACGDSRKLGLTYVYVVPSARWRPEYDLRVDAEESESGKVKAELSVGAIIEQSTGEDWDNSEIVLSTAKPSLGANALVPAPIWVDGAILSTKKVLVQANERREANLSEGGTTEAGPSGASLEDGGRVFSFTLKQRASISADGHPMWFAVDTVPMQVEVARYATPALAPYVYRVSRQKNAAPYPLLAGTVHVFRKRTFMGDVALKYTAPGEQFETSLGIDETLRIERRPVKEIDRAPKLLGATKAWERHYRIRLNNIGDRTATIEVKEAVPLSKVKDVTVELDAKATSPAFEHDKDRGFLTWRVPVERGVEKTVDLAYTVRIPKEWETR